MLSQLADPFVLARTLTGLVTALLLSVGLRVAVQVRRRWRLRALSEGQLILERRAELVATLVQGACAFGVAAWILSIVTIDRAATSIRGAMCAYGVLESTPWGYPSFAVTGIAVFGLALWSLVHRLDLELPEPDLTPRKFAWLWLLTPLLWLDLLAWLRFVLDLDFSVVASCCSTTLDSSTTAVTATMGGPGPTAAWLSLASIAAVIVAALAVRRRPSPWRSGTLVILSVGAVSLTGPAVAWYIAPHAFETPHHQCPFCLLHSDVLGLGWPLFGALFVGAVVGVGVGVLELYKHHDRERTSHMQQRLARTCAIAWAGTALLGALPVVRYMWITQGASLWG